MLSGFKYVMKDYDIKDHGKVQVDLQYLASDLTSRTDVIHRLFDDDITICKTPYDHSIIKQEPASEPDDQPVIEIISDDQDYDAPKQADVENVPAVNPMEKQYLHPPKTRINDLTCFSKKSQPPEGKIDDATVVVASPNASTVNGCPFEPKKVDGCKIKLQSWVKPSHIKRNTKHSHLIMKMHPQYHRSLGSNDVLNIEKTFLVGRLLGSRNQHSFHSFEF